MSLSVASPRARSPSFWLGFSIAPNCARAAASTLTRGLIQASRSASTPNDSEASKTISALKVQVGKAGKYIGQQAVQLHGGMGVSNEMSIGHYLKRFTVIDSMFGNTQHHINKYSSL